MTKQAVKEGARKHTRVGRCGGDEADNGRLQDHDKSVVTGYDDLIVDSPTFKKDRGEQSRVKRVGDEPIARSGTLAAFFHFQTQFRAQSVSSV